MIDALSAMVWPLKVQETGMPISGGLEVGLGVQLVYENDPESEPSVQVRSSEAAVQAPALFTVRVL